MRILLILLILIFNSQVSNSQILDLSNPKNKGKVISIPYDSSFVNFDEDLPVNLKAGIVGEEIYLSDASKSQLKDSFNKPLSDELMPNLSNRVYFIDSFELLGSITNFFVTDENGKRFIFSPNESEMNWYILGGLQKFKNAFVGRSYKKYSTGNLELKSETGDLFLITENPIKIEDIQYAKLKNGYSIVSIFDNGLISKVELNLGDYSKLEIENYLFIENVDLESEFGGGWDGGYDDSGDGVFGRRVIFRDPSMLANPSNKSGKIVFKVCINRRGTVTYVEIVNNETTIKDKLILKRAQASLEKYKYEPDFSAPIEQCGRYSMKIDNYKSLR